MPCWPRISTDLGKIAQTGLSSSPLFASLSIQVDIKVENDVCFYFDADAFSAD